MELSAPIELIELVNGSRHVLCISHVSPDGDAYGSLLGMVWLLRSLGKRAVPAMHDPLLPEFAFLPGATEILGPHQVGDDYDLIVCLDCSSADRMGDVYWADRHGQSPLVVIDHHISNTRFGRINWVDPGAAATCEMLTRLTPQLGAALDRPLADCLLTGIVTDTLAFRTTNTTPATLEAAMQLQAAGADLAAIVGRTLNRMPFSTLQLWSLVLPAVRLEDGVLWVVVTQRALQTTGARPEEVKLNSIFATVNEADISAVFTEKIGEKGQPAVECSFRARPGFSVVEIAAAFGGGGHPPAAGVTIAGAVSDVLAQVVPAMKAARRRQAQHLS